jgi:hypothetical protein
MSQRLAARTRGRIRVTVVGLLLSLLVLPADRAAASGTINDPEAFRVIMGLPVLALLGGGGAAVTMLNFQQDSDGPRGRPRLGLGLGLLNLGMAAAYIPAMQDGAGAGTMAMMVGHAMAGVLGVASSVRLFKLKREGQLALTPLPMVAGEDLIPAIGLVARW